MRSWTRRIVGLLFLQCAIAIALFPQAPRTMSYQGVLTDTTGNPVPDGVYQLYVTFYTAGTGGTTVASRGPISTTTTHGLFSIIIGNGEAGNAPLTDFPTNQQLWLGLKVGSDAAAELTPRSKLTGTFYAFHADTADVALNAGGGSLTLPFNGSVSSASPAFAVTNSGSGSTSHGIAGYTGSGGGTAAGVYGKATTGDANGVYGENSSSTAYATGVWGSATSATGQTYGVGGTTSSNTQSAAGVEGTAYSTTGVVYGVLGNNGSSGQFAAAVDGYEYSTKGQVFGVQGYTTSGGPYAVGVSGYAAADTGVADGVQGQTQSNNSGAAGVVGIATAPAAAVLALGNTYATGTKSAIVPLNVANPKDLQSAQNASEWRALYAVEATEVWFEDMGFASLQNGKATVTIDAAYGKTANLNQPYHVFITPYGNCNSLSVTARTATSFTVEEQQGGKSSVEFSYRIVAKRLGYENTRLEQRPNPLLQQSASSKILNQRPPINSSKALEK